MHPLLANLSPFDFWLPATLCVYYFIALLLVGKGPAQGVIVAKYGPPGNMSPAEVRYLLNGSTDRKSVSAVLVHLATKKLITIQPENGDYRITLLVEEAPEGIPSEEAAAMRALAEIHSFANPESKICKGGSFLLKPARNHYISLLGSVISGSVNARVEKDCFNRNLRYSVPAFALSFFIVMAMAGHYGNARDGVIFLTAWFMFCSFIVGLITAVSVAPVLQDAMRGRIVMTNIWTAMVPLLMFGAVLGFVDTKIAKLLNPAFAYTLVAVVMINIGFAISLKRLTPAGRQRLDEVLGFRQFLSTVEIDRLDRMNNPHLTPVLMNDYLAYAIALDLKEAWGDHLSSALFATVASVG
ncbi:MAG TPA: hypothetical protein VLK33_09850 [Terriglobales bacterium]|nr:hypothetical protein [Terriglobales bacterium]